MTELNKARDLKCSRVARALWPQSTEQKIQVVDTKPYFCISKYAVGDIVMFLKSIYCPFLISKLKRGMYLP